MKNPDYKVPGDGKKEYHVITPEGREVLFGYFKSEGAAQSLFKRKFPADWRSLATLIQSDVELKS